MRESTNHNSLNLIARRSPLKLFDPRTSHTNSGSPSLVELFLRKTIQIYCRFSVDFESQNIMKGIFLALIVAVVIAFVEAKPKWKKVLQERKQRITEEEHRQHCSEIECPKYSACKIKKTGKAVKAICVKCKPCPEEGESRPVCGTDGNQYESRCALHYQACMHNKIGLLKVKCHSTCAECNGNRVKEHMIDNNRLPKADTRDSDGYLTEGQPEEEEQEMKETEEIMRSKRYKKWNQWKQYKHDFEKYKMRMMEMRGIQLTDENNCTQYENSTLGARLLDWFHVLRSEYLKLNLKKAGKPVVHPIIPQMDLRQAHEPYPCGHHHGECREPINFMFHYLDMNDDHVLGQEELLELKQIPYEHCITQFLNGCDKTRDNQLSIQEFCECFPIEPPCLAKLKDVPTILQRGQPIPLPGHFVPRCDADGFFLPMQCHMKATAEFCWCVDRNGGKIEGTYKKGRADCDDNTINPRDNEDL